jgi:adenylate kinase
VVLLLFGPPGSGKGTQSRLIANWLNIPAISTGDMLRAEITAETELGRAAQAIVVSGGLVGDDLVNEMLRHRIARPDCERGFLLDGYPRTVEQAGFLDGLLAGSCHPPVTLIHFDVPYDALAGRMTARRQCPQCLRVYNVLYSPPKTPGVCDDDGVALFTRKDDEEHVFRDRFTKYQDVTRPVLAHYGYTRYYQIRGDRSPQYIFEEITGILEPLLAGGNGDFGSKAAPAE